MRLPIFTISLLLLVSVCRVQACGGLFRIDPKDHYLFYLGYPEEKYTEWKARTEKEFRAENMVPTRSDDFMGIRFDFLRNGEKEDTFEISLPGDFSVHNALAVLAVCELMDLDLAQAKEGLRTVRVPGRCQIKYLSKDFGIIIDYAHNDISLEGIIKTVRAYGPKRIITLFGSVGDRAQLRREELGGPEEDRRRDRLICREGRRRRKVRRHPGPGRGRRLRGRHAGARRLPPVLRQGT